MAITQSSQILDASKVDSAVTLIDDVVGYLTKAKESITTAKKYCDESVFCTNEGNPFPADIQKVDAQLSDEITKLKNLKTTISSEAHAVRTREQNELAAYQEEQRKKAEEARKAEEAKKQAAQSQNTQMMTV